jgi:hypothetical protein
MFQTRLLGKFCQSFAAKLKVRIVKFGAIESGEMSEDRVVAAKCKGVEVSRDGKNVS